ncbi:hypothetical protein GOP47_0015526 [Adiantum capillus-veneris]|uniref:Uncharacterized protein n=1 Tax=Adiantum capillus-veneris TaxID=13818 RepID=A0A9D4UJX2_ADICA|nr:hypothetical protein GOP47_0015526 [Adiantum capillus-veneris]
MPSAPCLDGAIVLGIWQSGGKASSRSRIPNLLQERLNGSPEQVSALLKRSKKAIKGFSLGSYQSLCGAKWFCSEAQEAEFETWQLTNLSQDPQTADAHMGAFSDRHIEATHADPSRGLHMPVHQFEERKCGEGGSMSSVVAPSHAGHVHAEHKVDHVFAVWKDPSPGLQGACADGQMSGGAGGVDSAGGMDGSLSHVDNQGVRFGHVNGSEDALKQGMDDKEATNSLRKIPALRLPTYRTPAYLQNSLTDSIRYLESLGVDGAKIFRDEPVVRSCTLEHIKALVSALERYGMDCKDAGRVFKLCHRVLLLDPEKDLKIATSFLFDEAGLLPKDFCKVIRRCPRLLVMDLDTHLRPTLRFLRTLGFVRIGHTIANNPALLSYDVETKILPRLRLLESWGFTYREAAAMVVRFPAIFNYSAVENLQCKYDYLVHEIKAGKKDLLSFPQYFGYSLESRIQPRHQRLAKMNVSLSIQAMLTLSDSEFNAKFPNVVGASREDEIGVSLYESIEAKLHDSNRELPKSTSLENSQAFSQSDIMEVSLRMKRSRARAES